MNLNEVIANRANELLGGKLGAKQPVHPNDHVNMSQSSNDSLASPRTTHFRRRCISPPRRASSPISFPALETLRRAFRAKEKAFAKIVKIGRTHTQDATSLTLGQEFSGYAAQVESGIARLRLAVKDLYPLAQGGTAVGTGPNSKPKFARSFAKHVAKITKLPFTGAANKFEALAANDAYVFAHGACQFGGDRPVRDRQRYSAVGIGSAFRPRRANIARKRTRLFDHAGQGQPDPM